MVVATGGNLASLTTRGIIGRFFRKYSEAAQMSFALMLGFYQPSNQKDEPYRMSGPLSRFREREGSLRAQSMEVYDYTITNKKFENSVAINVDDWRRDKSGQIAARVGELGMSARDHWDEILSELIENGTSTPCYDGSNFFATHTIGAAPNQQTINNNVAAAQVPALNVASATLPTQTEHTNIINGLADYMAQWKDESGKPLNNGVTKWYYMVPANMASTAKAAVRSERISGGESNPVLVQDYAVEVIGNAWLTDNDVVYLFRGDTETKPFILQEEKALSLEVFAEGSEHTAKEDEILIVPQMIRNVGFGEFLYAIRGQLS